MNDLERTTELLLQDKSTVSEAIEGDTFLDFIFILSLSFGILILIMISFLLINRVVQNRARYREDLLKIRYQEYLADFISIPVQDELTSVGVSKTKIGLSREDLTKECHREILLNELYELHQQLNGYQAEMLKHLFWGWSMQEDVIEGLSSRSCNRVKRSLDLVIEFGMTDQLLAVRDLVNSKHIDVRSMAMACCISLTNGSLDFLSMIDHELTDWEKHKVLHAIEGIEQRTEIDFEAAAQKYPSYKLFIDELRLSFDPALEQYEQWVEEIKYA